MRRFGFLAAAAAVYLTAAAAAPAQAAFGVFDYSTGVAVQAGGVPPADPAIGAGPVNINIGGGNFLQFGGNTGTTIDATLPGGADINFGDIVFTPSGANDGDFAFTASFNYTVRITDQSGGLVDDFTFTGTLSGNVNGQDPAALNSLVSNFIAAPTVVVRPYGTYTVTAKLGIGPGSTGGVITEGTLQGNVQFAPAAVPAPAGLLLVAAAVPAFGLRRLVRRKTA